MYLLLSLIISILYSRYHTHHNTLYLFIIFIFILSLLCLFTPFIFTLLSDSSLILAIAYCILPCNHSLFLYIIIHYVPTCHALPSFGSIPHILLQISLVHEFPTSNNHSITPISLNNLAYSIQSIPPADSSYKIFIQYFPQCQHSCILSFQSFQQNHTF